MEQFVKDQIKYGLKYLPSNLIKSYFIPKENERTKEFRSKQFICGVCHPDDNSYDMLNKGNIEWVRMDIPFPFEKDGVTVRESFKRYKEECAEYNKHGIKVMAVTPYPQSYLEVGADIREPDGAEKVCEITKFIFNELKDVIGGLQITNEMGMPRFTIPFTMKEAVKFIGEQLKAIYPIRGDVIIGYNSAGPQADLHSMMREYRDYFDYVGVDIYIGSFGAIPQFMYFHIAMLRYLWAFMQKPVILQEFGYIGDGKPKTKPQKIDILRKYGAESKKDAKTKMKTFVDKLPEHFSEHVKHLAQGDTSRYFNLLFKSDLRDHLYRELPAIQKIPGYDHTPEGQAKFYNHILPRLFNLPFVCGAIIYSYNDEDHCYVCGQNDCPVETRWGLVDRDGNPKPSYFAVQKHFKKIQDNIKNGIQTIK